MPRGDGPGAAGGRRAPPGAGAAVLGALAVLAAVASAGSRAAPERAYLDGPPPGHTGGFGEPSCQRCHFDAAVNPPEATLEVRGFPSDDGFAPDSTYRLTVLLSAPDLGRAGFELAIRCPAGDTAGRQAGHLTAPGERAEVVRGGGEAFRGDSTVLYARHTREGSRTTAPDSASWRLAWTAPGCASAVLHAAANAANGDASEFGDRVVKGSWSAGRIGPAR